MATQIDAGAVMDRLKADPVFFAREVLGVSQTYPKQEELLLAVRDAAQAARGEGSGPKRVAVKKCHTSGGTFAAAAAVLWALYCFRPILVATTAPTSTQLKIELWREIRKLHRRARYPLGGAPLPDAPKLQLADDWLAYGFATDDPQHVRGAHEGNVFVVVDEATGLHQAIMEEIEGLLSGGAAFLLMLMNPTNAAGPGHAAFHEHAELYRRLTISAFDTPNVIEGRDVIPGLITSEWVEERRKMWGEDSPDWEARVLAEFPTKVSGRRLIPLTFWEAAKKTTLEPAADDLAEMGLDLADQGGDETAIAIRKGPRVEYSEGWNDLPPMESVGRVVDRIITHGVQRVKYDRIGVGAGMGARLAEVIRERRIVCQVLGVANSAAPANAEAYVSLGDELAYGLADRFREGRVDLTKIADRVLDAQAVSREGEMASDGRRKLEPKPKIRSKGQSSPDRFDALVLAFAPLRARVAIV